MKKYISLPLDARPGRLCDGTRLGAGRLGVLSSVVTLGANFASGMEFDGDSNDT